MTDLLIPSAFSLAHYHLTLEAFEPLHLPPAKGNLLRGSFGNIFKRLVCFQPRQCQQRCQAGNACPYGYIFETSLPAGAEVLRNIEEVPRPFVIEPPADRRTLIPAGETLEFGLTLIGHGMNYLPYFIAVFRELGRLGLGRSQGRYHLVTVEAISPLTGQVEPVYRGDDELVRVSNLTLTGDMITPPPNLPPSLTLTFLTPTRLKHAGRWVNDGPPFQVLVKTLLTRLSSLSYFHCNHRLELDFRGLIDRAAEVRTVQQETRWEDWARFSGRQQQRVEMGGLVGRVTYAGALEVYRPLLVLGELIHVGKGTVFGNGQYRISQE